MCRNDTPAAAVSPVSITCNQTNTSTSRYATPLTDIKIFSYIIRVILISALEVIFNEMRYINLRLTYLLNYLLACLFAYLIDIPSYL